MERHLSAWAGDRLQGSFWVAALLGLFAWHGWMTLTLFGSGHPWQQLMSREPVLSGRHCLHLYHGSLGAQALRERGSLCCYDPAFQAGYPKTPIFDAGSRLAELSLIVVGEDAQPAAYKCGLLLSCLLVPVLLLLTAISVGLRAGSVWMVTAMGIVVWWCNPARTLLEAGDLHLLLGGLLAILRIALLVPFDRNPSVAVWAGLLICGGIGWFINPALSAALLGLDLLYYLSCGPRHELAWHLTLGLALIGGMAVNGLWLLEWTRHVWISTPRTVEALLPHRTFRTVWLAPLWGGEAERWSFLGLMLAAVLGVCLWHRAKNRMAARLFGLGIAGTLLCTLAGVIWEPAERFGTSRLLVLVIYFTLPPACYAVARGSEQVARLVGGQLRLAMMSGVGALLVAMWTPAELGSALLRSWSHTTPLVIGLGPEREAVVAAVGSQTDPSARILWEEITGASSTPRWTPLLPLLTGRSFLGGLDAEAHVEHAYAGLVDQHLAGRPLAEWSDAQLDAFCRRYNVGWVVCRSAASSARFRALPCCRAVTRLPNTDDGARELLTLQAHSFVLQGEGRLICANAKRITLGDLVPDDNGHVVLSFHFQGELTVSPPRVEIEREPDVDDPISFIRLKVPGPLSRVTLRWGR